VKAARGARRYRLGVAKKTSTKRTEPGPEDRIVLLKGADSGLRAQYVTRLREALEAAGAEVDLVRFSGLEASPGDVRSLGLMGQHKLVVLDDAHELVKGAMRPMFERYAQAPVEGATLVLSASGWRPGNIDKLIPNVGIIVGCDPYPPAKAKSWARKHAQERLGVELSPEAVELLVERVGTEIGPLKAEITKIAPSAEDGVVGVETVARLVKPKRRGDEKGWLFADELLNPDPSTALRKLRELMEVGLVDPTPLRWAAVDLARKVHAVARDIDKGVPPAGAGRGVRLWGKSGQMARQVGVKIGVHEAARLLHDALEADFRAKTGQTEPRRGLELLAIRFASAARLGADRP